MSPFDVRYLATTLVLALSLTACGGRSNDSVAIPAETPSATALATGAGAAALVTGPAATTQPPTLAQQIASLEGSGALPKLDRSKDIAGPDANANGVRDDIESWVNSQPVNDKQRRSLMQDARATQRTLLVDLKDRAALQTTSEGLAASLNCGGENFPDYVVFSRLAGKIESMTANTKERAARYMQYNTARSGSSTTMPSGDTCEP
ncbi:hypothetical protein [Variovorax sp. PvP013]|uniref:hypothetical protein n=1 Tax=Variovorax sp. PvP013 TaxID=3156435 RepID=UPI003D2179AD